MNAPIHVAVVRRVKPGCETAFEKALHDFVQRSLKLPGQMGVHIIRPVPGSDSREYGIIRAFANREALTAFRTSPEYLEWNQFALDLTEGSGRTDELGGLESWFTLPGQPLRPLPQWKMALVTFVAVDVVTTLLSLSIGPSIQSWPFLIRNSAFNVLVVVCLTWVAMPLLTRLFHGWLHPKQEKFNDPAPAGPSISN
jgi:antibiotic biosynthesis monooxygenase (ABM) superfamily enzyme